MGVHGMRDEINWPSHLDSPAGAVAGRPDRGMDATSRNDAAMGESREAAWAALPPLVLSQRQSDRGRLVSHSRVDPAHGVFDMMRTRVAQAMTERGWSRIAITSPTKNCGKTFVSANLALSLARRRSLRVGLLDLDLRLPSLAGIFGVTDAGEIGPLLEGAPSLAAHFRRLGDNLALACNDRPLADAAERLSDPRTGATLTRIQQELGLDLLVLDLPPMLACDDFLALAPHVDCALLVAGGGVTRAEEIRRCAKLIEGRTPLLGIILNRADDPDVERYHYGYERD